MQNIIHITPITKAEYHIYIEVGTKAYNQHYLHLWPNKNSSPYIESSFTSKVLLEEEINTNTILFLIYKNKQAIGVLKITLNSSLAPYSGQEALLVDKIYLLNKYSGKGIGKKILQFVMLRAKELKKKVVWLDTMQKGKALDFYLKNGFEIHSEIEIPFSKVIPEEKPMYILFKKVDSI